MLFSPSTSIVESSVKGKASISASNETSPAKRIDSSASNSLTTSENESIEVKSVLAMIEDTSLDNTVAIEPSASVALEISASNADSKDASAASLAAFSVEISALTLTSNEPSAAILKDSSAEIAIVFPIALSKISSSNSSI